MALAGLRVRYLFLLPPPSRALRISVRLTEERISAAVRSWGTAARRYTQFESS